MTQNYEHFELHDGGDRLQVYWDGNVWVSPSCGAQHAGQNSALRYELIDYLRASGERPEWDDLNDLDRYGRWVDEPAD